MQKTTHETPYAIPSNLHPFDEFLRRMGLTRTTGYRYRQRQMIKASDIYGKLYITTEEIQRFEARVLAGEFRRERKPSAKSAL